MDVAIPLMILRPSRWAGSRAAKESSTSTMSATSRVTPLPLRIATPTWAPLERAGVVDPVADHRDVVALPAQGRDQPFLVLGGDPTEHRGAGDEPVDGGVVEAVERGAGHRLARVEPGAGGERGDGAGVVAGEHLDRDAVSRNRAIVAATSGRSSSARATIATGSRSGSCRAALGVAEPAGRA